MTKWYYLKYSRFPLNEKLNQPHIVKHNKQAVTEENWHAIDHAPTFCDFITTVLYNFGLESYEDAVKDFFDLGLDSVKFCGVLGKLAGLEADGKDRCMIWRSQRTVIVRVEVC